MLPLEKGTTYIHFRVDDLDGDPNPLHHGKDMCYKYNQLLPSDDKARADFLKDFLGHVGKRPTVISPFYCDFGFNLSIGDNFYSNYNLICLDGDKITFGNNCWIGPNCSFYTNKHPFCADQRDHLQATQPITIGNDVWMGGNCTVLPGVTIGDRAVIGAGSLVTKDVPANHIAVGSPARILREISDEEDRWDEEGILALLNGSNEGLCK